MPRFHIIKAAASGSHPRAANAVVEEAGGCITPADLQRIHKLFDPRPDCAEMLRQRVIERERIHRWQENIGALCVIVAVASFIYFVARVVL